MMCLHTQFAVKINGVDTVKYQAEKFPRSNKDSSFQQSA